MNEPGNWNETDNGLEREFSFDDFIQAMKFVNNVAEEAEKVQHHPGIEIDYNKVTLTCITHDAGDTITEKDTSLAQTINDLYNG